MPATFPSEHVILLVVCAAVIGWLVRHKNLLPLGQQLSESRPNKATVAKPAEPSVPTSPEDLSLHHAMQMIHAQQQLYVRRQEQAARETATKQVLIAHQTAMNTTPQTPVAPAAILPPAA